MLPPSTQVHQLQESAQLDNFPHIRSHAQTVVALSTLTLRATVNVLIALQDISAKVVATKIGAWQGITAMRTQMRTTLILPWIPLNLVWETFAL